MKIAISVISIIFALAVVFFVFNVSNLEVVKLDNGIGSYSIVNVDLYDKNSNNVNVSTIIVNGSLIFDSSPVFYVNEASLNIDINSSNYPNLSEIYEKLNSFNVLNDKYDLIIKCVIDDFELPKEPGSNIPMTPERFHELYPNGLDIVVHNVKVYKVIMGVIPDDDNYSIIDNINVRVYCAPNPVFNPNIDIDNQYLVRVIPYGISYEYSLLRTFSNLDTDLNLIKAAKPSISNASFDRDMTETKWWEYALNFMVHPIKLLEYYTTSSEIIISDLSGMVLVNELEAYSPF